MLDQHDDASSLVVRNSEVVRRIARAHRVRRATAGLWFTECVRFLDLCAASDEPLAPSKKVDRAWHEFLLFTRLYHDFCEGRYGRFLHHDPRETSEPAAYDRTLAAYTARYGQPSRRIWPATGPAGSGCGGSGDGGCGGGGCGGG